MKKIILLFIFSISAIAQDKFEFKKEGLTDYVVTKIDSSASKLYIKTINWVKENYKNPSEVIKMTIENEKIRFQGFKENFYCIKSMSSPVCSNALYTIEISFKEGKYKIDPIELILINKSGLSNEIDLNDFSIYYDKKGNIKKSSEDAPILIEQLFNGLNENLKNYISNKIDKSEW